MGLLLITHEGLQRGALFAVLARRRTATIFQNHMRRGPADSVAPLDAVVEAGMAAVAVLDSQLSQTSNDISSSAKRISPEKMRRTSPMPFSSGPCDERCGPMCERTSFLTPAAWAISAAPVVPHWPTCLAVLVHDLLVVPAHAEHHVGAPRQVDHGLAGLGVAGEDDAALRAVQAVGQRVEPGLDVRSAGAARDLPGAARRAPGPGRRRGRADGRRHAGQDAAAIDVDLLAGRGVDPGDPVVGERADLLVEDAAGELGRSAAARTPGARCALPARLVPAAEQEARVVDVVVEVVVGEEEVVDLGRPEAGLDQLVGGGRAAVEHQVLAADLDDVRRAEPLGRGRRRAGPEDVEARHGASRGWGRG